MLAEMFYGLFEKIWEGEEIPSEWKVSWSRSPRKETLAYVQITLLSVPGKALNLVILERLRGPIDLSLRDQQAGSRPGRSRTYQITKLRNIVEQSIEWNSPSVNLSTMRNSRQPRYGDITEVALTLWGTYEVPKRDSELLWGIVLQSGSWRTVDGEVWFRDKGEAEMPAVTLLVPLAATDWITKSVTNQKRNEIQWTLWSPLDDVDFQTIYRFCHTNISRWRKTTSDLPHTSVQ